MCLWLVIGNYGTFFVGKTPTFEWKAFSTLEQNTADPKAGECIKYGDVIYLSNNYNPDYWLTGSRGTNNLGVGTRDYWASEEEQAATTTYQWMILTEEGNGSTTDGSNGTGYGSCVYNNAVIYLVRLSCVHFE